MIDLETARDIIKQIASPRKLPGALQIAVETRDGGHLFLRAFAYGELAAGSPLEFHETRECPPFLGDKGEYLRQLTAAVVELRDLYEPPQAPLIECWETLYPALAEVNA